MTYCRLNGATATATDKDCGDGQKYDSIEKDKDSKDLDSALSTTSVKVKFSDLKAENVKQDSPKTFNFQTVIHRASKEGNDTNSFDTNKTKFEFLFKDSDSMAPNNTSKATEVKSKVPDFSLVGV